MIFIDSTCMRTIVWSLWIFYKIPIKDEDFFQTLDKLHFTGCMNLLVYKNNKDQTRFYCIPTLSSYKGPYVTFSVVVNVCANDL
jgi:hypothetical protein